MFPGADQLGQAPRIKGNRRSPASFWTGTFTGKIDQCLAHGERRAGSLRRATEAEVRSLLDEARKLVPIGDTDLVWRMLAKNPDIIRAVIPGAGRSPAGVFAYLPLSAFGAASIVAGRFDGAEPDPAWITRPGESPDAIYLWLIHAPRQFSKVLGEIARLFRNLSPEGVPIFSRATNPSSAKLQRSAGFIAAAKLYPGAPEWLLVTLPDGQSPAEPRRGNASALSVETVRDMAGLAQVFALRSATYIAEQFCTYEEEFDGNDFCATHFIGRVDGDPAGCIRLRYFGGFAKLERLCVRREYRGRGLKEELVRAALDHARAKKFTRIYGHARFDLVEMWARFGFKPVEGRPAFRFANIDYVEIICELEPDEAAISLGVPPMMTTRPEGAWDEPGPLDWSNLAEDPQRAALIARHTRFRG